MKRVFVAGHKGMVGSAIVRMLKEQDNIELITRDRVELDLLNPISVNDFFAREKIDQVYLAAAKVGGITANNSFPADFIYQNISLQNNIIQAAHSNGVQKLLYLGSSCIYPKYALQPMKESALLTGKLEQTNEPYAVAKIAGIKMCESYNRQYGRDYRSVMPTNLYGENDNFHKENSHVIPALLRRFHEAKKAALPRVVIWGTGEPMREFMHVDDLASASIYVMNLDSKVYSKNVLETESHINVGTGKDITIRELAEVLAKVVEYEGDLVFDHSKPDGTPRKLLDVSKLASLGWNSSIDLEAGLYKTYQWFLANQESFRK